MPSHLGTASAFQGRGGAGGDSYSWSHSSDDGLCNMWWGEETWELHMHCKPPNLSSRQHLRAWAGQAGRTYQIC